MKDKRSNSVSWHIGSKAKSLWRHEKEFAHSGSGIHVATQLKQSKKSNGQTDRKRRLSAVAFPSFFNSAVHQPCYLPHGTKKLIIETNTKKSNEFQVSTDRRIFSCFEQFRLRFWTDRFEYFVSWDEELERKNQNRTRNSRGSSVELRRSRRRERVEGSVA